MSSILKVGEIQDPTNGNTALTIDSSGRVSRSVVPAWRVGLSANQTISQGSSTVDVTFDNSSTENCFIQGGCTLSSGVITVPIAGLYQINTTIRMNSVSANYLEIYMTINDVRSGFNNYSYQLIGSPNSSYDSGSVSSVFSLSANDNVRIEVFGGGDTSHAVSGYSVFSGVFLG